MEASSGLYVVATTNFSQKGMHIVTTTNSLFETTDESCLLISGIPTVLLIDPCEN